MSHVEIRGLSKSYGEMRVLNDVNLSLAQGESLVLLGPSGCGKTTCLRMIAGFDVPDGGTIEVAGRTLVDEQTFVQPNKRNMSVVFQNYALWPHMTVERNIASGPRLRKTSREEIARKVEHALSLVHLEGLGRRYIHQLSGGQQQRVSLARALVNSPDVLLLDEPLSNLDTRLREEMRFEIKRLQSELGVSMVYVTHDQEEALSLADQIVVMQNGRVAQRGAPAQVYEHPMSEYVASVLGSVNVLSGAVARTDQSDVVVSVGPHEFRARTPPHVDAWTGRGPVDLLVRPTDIVLQTVAGNAAGKPRGTIDEVHYYGSFVEYGVSLEGEGQRLRVRAISGPLHDAGDAVTVNVASERFTLVESSS